MSEEIVTIRWDDDRQSLNYSMSFMSHIIEVYQVPHLENPYQIEISDWAVSRWQLILKSSLTGILKPQQTVDDAFREAVQLIRKYNAARQLTIDQTLGERVRETTNDAVSGFISSAEDDGYRWNKHTEQWER